MIDNKSLPNAPLDNNSDAPLDNNSDGNNATGALLDNNSDGNNATGALLDNNSDGNNATGALLDNNSDGNNATGALLDNNSDGNNATGALLDNNSEENNADAALVLAPAIDTNLVNRQSATLVQHAAAATLYLANLATSSRRTMAQSLDVIAHLLAGPSARRDAIPWGELRYPHVQAIRAAFVRACEPDEGGIVRMAVSTANRHLTALRGVLGHAWRAGLMGAEDYHRAVDFEPVRGSTLPAGRALSVGEMRALFEACALDKNPARAARDATVIALVYQAGLRRGEAARLNLDNFNPTDGTIQFRGKGNKERLNALAGGGREAIDTWIALRGPAPGPLVCPIGKGGRIVLARRLTGESIRFIVRHRAQLAGVLDISPHDFRRTAISDLLDAGEDLATVQRFAGHSDPKTTSRYDRRGQRTTLRAVGKLHVPFVRR
jgi:integrase